mgnify:CR=1 FL=1
MWYKLAQQLQLPGLDVEQSAPKSKEKSEPKSKSPELLETQKELSFRRDLYALQNQLADQLRKYLIEARAEAKKWKDNHDNQVKINQLLIKQ